MLPPGLGFSAVSSYSELNRPTHNIFDFLESWLSFFLNRPALFGSATTWVKPPQGNLQLLSTAAASLHLRCSCLCKLRRICRETLSLALAEREAYLPAIATYSGARHLRCAAPRQGEEW